MMNYRTYLALCALFFSTITAFSKSDFQNIFLSPSECIAVSDSDSVKVDINAQVISYGNRLFQQGIQIGTFDKRSSVEKLQMTVRVQIYDLNGKAVADAVAAGINASFAVHVFDGDQRLSLDLDFDHEAEQLALKLRQLGKL
jgi:hypothetical protein